MRNTIYILIAALGCALTSCMKPFDPDFDENPVIFLESFPGSDAEYVSFTILPAYSRSNTPVVIPFDPDITFTVNGDVVPLECVSAEDGFYIAHHKPMSGDRMTISVSCEGFQSIDAETFIPEAFPERKVDYRKVAAGIDEYDNVLFITASELDPDFAYGLQILKEKIYQYQTGPEVRTYNYAGELYPDSSDPDFEVMPANIEAMTLRIYGSSFWAWQGKSLQSTGHTFAIQPHTYGYRDEDLYDSLFEYHGETKIYDDEGAEIGTVPTIEHNKLLLFTMTDEFYKYKVAQELESDYSGFLGFLAPANYCYSNINNGYGAFAGISVSGTDWITKEFIENNR